ncbi:MAG TPA: phytoene desaturase family protein, partial [Flavobacteriales bacterium]|nr:phytoene desaturase family protein [Flavobacteriales bacterium]
VIGSGVAGLAAAATLAQAGYAVTVVEKNAAPGGRASVWKSGGFTFDMGPSFYWMPDVFERFFARFGHRVADLYDLRRLDPSYSIVFGPGDRWALPAGIGAVAGLFEREEKGAATALHRFLREAELKYELGMSELVYQPSLSWMEYARPKVVRELLRVSALSSLRKHVHAHFQSPRIRQVMEFPVLFLGATPQDTPALYSLMNHADIALGTWYPMGGMGRLIDAMVRVAEEQGAVIKTSSEVLAITTANGRVTGVDTVHGHLSADHVVATADYAHVEQRLLPPALRSYSDAYWQQRVMAPSTLLFYLGVQGRLEGLDHHTLFFDASLDAHGADLFVHKQWPRDPLFYVSCASRTDPSVAPEGHENVVVLIPIPSSAEDTEALRERYFHIVMDRLERHLGATVRERIVIKRSYCVNDLIADHHAFRGNAYGLANTLRQTGPWRPSVKSKKVSGLYFAGQLSVPGPGLPPAVISGQVAADLLLREHVKHA